MKGRKIFVVCIFYVYIYGMEMAMTNGQQSEAQGVFLENTKDTAYLYTKIDEGTWLYKLGKAFARMGDIVNAARFLSDAFFLRGNCSSSEAIADWKLFHDVQFSLYLLGKRSMQVSLSEGDMIHDLIEQRWLRLQDENLCSEFPFLCTDKRTWYSTIIIDFPWDAICTATRLSGEEDQECVSMCSRESALKLLSWLNCINMTH